MKVIAFRKLKLTIYFYKRGLIIQPDGTVWIERPSCKLDKAVGQ